MLLITACGKTDDKKESEPKETYIKISEMQEVEGLRFTELDINVEPFQKAKSAIRGRVENITEDNINLELIELELYDEDKNYLIKTTGSIGEILESNEIKEFSIVVEYDLTNSVYVKYKIVR